jgi:GPH family glycoside/pentoside/hexuronide:cation symporter
MKEAYKGMFKSRPFIVLAVTGVLISGQLQFASFNSYLYKNYFENTNLSMVGSVAQYLPMAIMILFTPKLVKKFGKKELAGFGSMFAAAAAVLCYVFKPGRDQAWLFMIVLFVIGFGYSFVSITNWAVVADVIDYQYVKTGIRSESAIYAVYTFSRKLGQTVADYVGLMLLNKIGYTEEMTKIGYKEGVSEGILMICTLIPAITYTLIWILYRFAYPLTKEKLEPIYEKVRLSNESLEKQEKEEAVEV